MLHVPTRTLDIRIHALRTSLSYVMEGFTLLYKASERLYLYTNQGNPWPWTTRSMCNDSGHGLIARLATA
jgi:hypothetical protein